MKIFIYSENILGKKNGSNWSKNYKIWAYLMSESHLLHNIFNIGDYVTIYSYTKRYNEITAMEFRKTDQKWYYQVGHGKWWRESSLKLIT